MNDAALEKEIQLKASRAPRVTLEHIEDVIISEHYFTAEEGVLGARLVEGNEDDEVPGPLSLLTFCVLILANGFTVTGTSACASPENFNEEIGRKIARDNAKQEIWRLEGYLLREKLSTGQA